MTITYETKTVAGRNRLLVKMGRKTVGWIIATAEGGYRYAPAGITDPARMGAIMPTVAAVKASIEGDA